MVSVVKYLDSDLQKNGWRKLFQFRFAVNLHPHLEFWNWYATGGSAEQDQISIHCFDREEVLPTWWWLVIQIVELDPMVIFSRHDSAGQHGLLSRQSSTEQHKQCRWVWTMTEIVEESSSLRVFFVKNLGMKRRVCLAVHLLRDAYGQTEASLIFKNMVIQ